MPREQLSEGDGDDKLTIRGKMHGFVRGENLQYEGMNRGYNRKCLVQSRAETIREVNQGLMTQLEPKRGHHLGRPNQEKTHISLIMFSRN